MDTKNQDSMWIAGMSLAAMVLLVVFSALT